MAGYLFSFFVDCNFERYKKGNEKYDKPEIRQAKKFPK